MSFINFNWKIKAKTKKRGAIIFGAIFFVLLITVETNDDVPFEGTDYARLTQKSLDSAFIGFGSDTTQLQTGWNKQNITPTKPIRLVGFGVQDNFEHVHDSVFVRTFFLSDGKKSVALLSFDLLFVHPVLKQEIERRIKAKTGLVDHIYYTATHTHNSFGGWGYSKLLDKVMVAGYDQDIVNDIADKVVLSIFLAKRNLSLTTTAYQSLDFSSHIRNRINGEDPIDSTFKVLKLRNDKKQDAYISTFSAHATCLYGVMSENHLSGDYPGMMSANIEKDTMALFAFCAGGIGSYSPMNTKSQLKETREYADRMTADLLSNENGFQFNDSVGLEYYDSPLFLGEPHLRLTRNLRLRPWVFRLLFGEFNPRITSLRIGNTVFIGFPAEISGELYLEEIEKARQKNINLVITSLNGSYLGYIMPDRYYYTETSKEVRWMNWFGPVSGSYFKSIIGDIVERY